MTGEVLEVVLATRNAGKAREFSRLFAGTFEVEPLPPEVEMPVYDERGMESIKTIGLGMNMEDPLTTANLGKIFVE